MRIVGKALAVGFALLFLTGCATPPSVAETTAQEPAPSYSPAEIVIKTEAPAITIFTEDPTDASAPSLADIEAPETHGPVTTEGAITLALLDEIPVKGRAPKTGYDRDLFGSGWGDPDRNGCDTRNDILARDLTVHTYQSASNDCVVLTGSFVDPYTGESIDFQRGQGTSNAVQIDHVVALSDAWQKGAQQLSPDARYEFANDPRNLLAVDGPTNASKGDSDAASWLPPNRGFWCEYVTRQVEIKHKYDLWMTQAEHDVSAQVLTENCG